MEKHVDKIKSIIQKIISQSGRNSVEFSNHSKLIQDLGLRSLDIAQLIATLELEFEVDPFSTGRSISDLVTVENLYTIYKEAIEKNNKDQNYE